MERGHSKNRTNLNVRNKKTINPSKSDLGFEKPVYRPKVHLHSHKVGKYITHCEKCLYFHAKHSSDICLQVVPPAPRLVGIEENPGPPKRAGNKNKSKKIVVRETISLGPRKKRGNNKNKNKKKGLAASMMSFGADSSGLNKSVGFTNRSVVEQRFEPRMEKVANLTGTAAFTMSQALFLNPGNSTLFPIFSQEAAVYEQYRCNLLRFWYRSTEYTASGSNVGAGLVLLATNFDPDDAQFATSKSMENYWHGTSDAPFAPSGKGVLCHDVLAGYKHKNGSGLREASLKNYYVNPAANTSAPTSQAAKFYDMGLFQLATEGNVVSTDKIGELWVEYSFTMIHPKEPEFPIGGSAIHVKLYADDATQASSLGLTPFTTGSVASSSITASGVAPGSTLSVANMNVISTYTASTVGLNDTSDTVINLPNVSGTWLCYFQWAGATAISAIPTLTAGGGATSIGSGFPSGYFGFFLAAGTSSTIMKIVTTTATSTPTAASNSLTLTGNTGMTDGNVDVWIVRVPTSLVTFLSSNINIPPSYSSELQELRAMIVAMQRQRITCDSDFEEEEKTSSSCSLTYNQTQRGTDQLSQSTLGLIGDIIARKSSSNKK